MSLNRRSFLTAIFGAPIAAKAIERIIENGLTKPAIVPVKPTAQPAYESAISFKWDPKVYAVSGILDTRWHLTGESNIRSFIVSG